MATGPAASLPPTAPARPSTPARRRLLRRPRRPFLAALIGVPLALLLVAAVAATPILYQMWQAKEQVFVDPVERQRSSLMPVLNTSGTPVLAPVPTEFAEPSWDGKERLTILLLGVDKPAGGAARTDTIILVNIDPVAKQAAMLSIPRDTKVVIPGYGINKINAAFALGEYNKVAGGGAGLTMRTIEANFGIPVHHFAQIDFAGFVRVVDTVGGITVDVPYPIKDDAYPGENYTYQRVYFPAGWQHLDGTRGLQYARTRHADGDAQRSARQQQVLLALRDQAIGLDLLPKLPELIEDLENTVRTDLREEDAVRLARVGAEIPRDQIAQYSLLPALYEEQLPDQPYYLVPDWELAAPILSEFTGTAVNPPGAALTNPSYDLPILIENGTVNNGLAGRIADILIANGFTNVEVRMAANAGSHPTTTIVDRGGNLGTSALITNLIGIGADKIEVVDAPWAEASSPEDAASEEQPVASPAAMTMGDGTGALGNGVLPEEAPLSGAERERYAVVVTLGNDAPDPAGSELQLDEYQEQIGDEPLPVDQPVDGGEPALHPEPEPTVAADG